MRGEAALLVVQSSISFVISCFGIYRRLSRCKQLRGSSTGCQTGVPLRYKAGKSVFIGGNRLLLKCGNDVVGLIKRVHICILVTKIGF